jgi:hypothetical protein
MPHVEVWRVHYSRPMNTRACQLKMGGGAPKKGHCPVPREMSVCHCLCQYRLARVPEPVRASILRWLAGYRRPYVRVADVAGPAAADGAAWPGRGLIDLASGVGDPIAVLPTLFHLLWRGELSADLDVPLSDRTWIGVCGV